MPCCISNVVFTISKIAYLACLQEFRLTILETDFLYVAFSEQYSIIKKNFNKRSIRNFNLFI
jgi:hypothetical protein